ncbi:MULTISPECIES: PLP-dependent transferase [unclassified Shinella]|uniref:trans-sulfuration enzyme family protein n=1 Tax=unclassified Shinella TaxID=2643062 RepID=UPI00225C88CC|nr:MULTISPECIES: PLP-dependent transferase [unclassified Shinella]MCO5136432.1 PLP-dependent transferase [Shinella sp.]MDC7253891.1 PLP-dependent transferase [Shinella sp. YE25]CAI0336543.1 putative cystathionine beta-lyase [Rhizobiaceae bacterium]CAK7255077.1 putative cystathionine beta-lyase [Shinella sp. WSC3-e]
MNDLTQCVLTPSVSMDGFAPLGVGVHRASTIVFEDAAAYASRGERGHEGYSYGLYGTPTTRTLEAKLTSLEGGTWTFLAPSGQAANAFAVLPFLAAGDHILIADTAYPPMRDFATTDLRRLGVEVGFFDPKSPDDVRAKMRATTKIVWCESPGSSTMEILDLPAIARIAHEHGALVGVDNTWATPLNFKPLEHGADIVTEALTKFVSGHSDVLMGSITIKDTELLKPIRSLIGRMGIGVSPDDASLVLRGFETFGVRLRHSERVALQFARKIELHPLVEHVLHPALETSPDHALWKRDFLGSSGVFSILFKNEAIAHIPAALDTLKVFAIGASWGGTRSLAAPMSIDGFRSATSWSGPDVILRLSIGLEDEYELWADIEGLLASLDQAVTNAETRAERHTLRHG